MISIKLAISWINMQRTRDIIRLGFGNIEIEIEKKDKEYSYSTGSWCKTEA